MTYQEIIKIARARELAANGDAQRLRRAVRLSLTDVAKACNASPSAVHRWETGHVVPRSKAALRYANLLALLADLPAVEEGGRQ